MYTITVQALVHTCTCLKFFEKDWLIATLMIQDELKIPVDEVRAIHEFYIMSLSEQTSFRPIKIH